MGTYNYFGGGFVINSGAPSQRISTIEVNRNFPINDIDVEVAIDHTYTSDLRIFLEGPNGQQVRLFNRYGLNGDNINAKFDDEASQHISQGSPPYFGTFRPDEDGLSKFDGTSSQGTWKLIVQDVAFQDGGELFYWRMRIDMNESSYAPQIIVKSGITASQAKIFKQVESRIKEFVVGDVSEANLPGYGAVDDLVVFASGKDIDGAGSVLGQAGPSHLRYSNNLPIAGFMEFDRADLASMEEQGILFAVILHEMLHVMGFGTIWRDKGLIKTENGKMFFVGENAMRVYGGPVPLENGGGPGTRGSHWSEEIFQNELMTGYIDAGTNPLSKLTIASLADIGYVVDENQADLYKDLVRTKPVKIRETAEVTPIIVKDC